MHSRRKFIQASLLAGLVAESSEVLAEDKSEIKPVPAPNGTITLLQTTDVHCQLHAHDELFGKIINSLFEKQEAMPI